MTDRNKALVRRLFEEIWNGRRLDVVEEILDPEHVLHDPSMPQPVRGYTQYRSFARLYLDAYPDLHFTVEEQVAEGDMVILSWTAIGTHDGDLPAVPATGRRVTVRGMTMARVQDGRIVEEDNAWDALGMLRQLGLTPAPTQLTA